MPEGDIPQIRAFNQRDIRQSPRNDVNWYRTQNTQFRLYTQDDIDHLTAINYAIHQQNSERALTHGVLGRPPEVPKPTLEPAAPRNVESATGIQSSTEKLFFPRITADARKRFPGDRAYSETNEQFWRRRQLRHLQLINQYQNDRESMKKKDLEDLKAMNEQQLRNTQDWVKGRRHLARQARLRELKALEEKTLQDRQEIQNLTEHIEQYRH